MCKQRKCCFYKHLVGFVLLLSFLSSIMFVYASDTTAVYTPVLQSDFEQCVENNYFSGVVSGGNWSGILPESKVKAVSGTAALSGTRSLQIQQCDIQWNDFKAEDYGFRIGFKLRLEEDFNQNIQFILSTQDTLTELSSEAGILLEIYNNERNETVLYGSDRMTPLAELNKNKTYTVELFIERGSETVQIALNGTNLNKAYSFISKVYFIDGLRICSTIIKDGELGGLWCLDDVAVETRPRTFAQPFSGQTPGNIPEVSVPEPSVDALHVYVNGVRIGVTKMYASSQTVYISAEQFLKSINVPYVYDSEHGVLTVENDRVSAIVSVPDTKLTVNGSIVELTYPVRMIDQVVMVPPQFINEVFNAKVWWDYDAGLLVITTGAYKNNDKLMRLGSKLYMNGEPYYAVGAHLDGMFQTVMTRYLTPGYDTEASWTNEAERELSKLKEQGVKAIRFSCSTDLLPDLLYDDVSMGKYLEAMDALLNVCDRYEIQVVLCLDLISSCFIAKENAPRYGWIAGDEGIVDLVANPLSKSRGIILPFLGKFVSRYKNRHTILMYEIANTANLRADTGVYMNEATYSLGQLASFYKDCVTTIRNSDPNCIISSGDGIPLKYQLSLYHATMQGRVAGQNEFTKKDTTEQQLEALWLLHEHFDVISLQFDDTRLSQMDTFYFSGTHENTLNELPFYVHVAYRFGKPLYSGLSYGLEGNAQTDGIDRNLYQTILSGMPLSFWQELSPVEMTQGTQLLYEKYAVNAVSGENTNVVWMNSIVDVFNPEDVLGADALDDGDRFLDRFLLFVTVSVVLIVFSAIIVSTFKNKKVV
ncbi:MAG: cellulase family glycosylhydrolase [Clostridia bacterium]|nr:cellulase family glycosylhydrolase [Clostridia bacterium]